MATEEAMLQNTKTSLLLFSSLLFLQTTNQIRQQQFLLYTKKWEITGETWD